MWTLFKKELGGFFNSFTGYVVIICFLLLNGLFMWVFKGQMNIIDGGYASLDTLFALAPWVFLFLVPAITMRMFAGEKSSGTIELLFTRPINEIQISTAKFLAAWVLVIVSILPTLIYYFSVYRLGSPVGNIDSGAVWGSYIGLIFLGGIYAAIGVFSSSVTENQVVAFILSVFFSFLCYLGFSFISQAINAATWGYIVEVLGIDYHYRSISRGVVDSRDIIYFCSSIFLFLYLTRLILVSRKW